MEIIKLILNLLANFFQFSTQKKKEDLDLAETHAKAITETIRASSNAHAIEVQKKTQKALEDVSKRHIEERKHQNDDDQFGSNW